MSYQVLARKWRPGNFHEMVGQEHVMQALINALDHQRLHHAYLFTGTRGVGKTTIARILAKCLNCERGVSSNPCGQCGACTEISEGRFVDLIEVDAASRTKVEDTRELLENVQYAPTRGRYKVYLIDEVHMLSGHSFNALLKTLEEPPPHVKFLLATTDPQKLPVTILSRCLQFHLKNMSPERIVGHLSHVLEAESVAFEEPALWSLARAADGSMRDAMSLTDQAIAFGNSHISEQSVNAMLGTIDHSHITDLLTALAHSNAKELLSTVQRMSEQSPDYPAALAELLAVLHRIAIAQVVPDALDNHTGDREQVLSLASIMACEDVQLFYQIGLNGRRDLPMASDPRSGFEMTLLRMLAFKPAGLVDMPTQPINGVSHPELSSSQSETSFSSALPEAPAISEPVSSDSVASDPLMPSEEASRPTFETTDQPPEKTDPEPEIHSVVESAVVETDVVETDIVETDVDEAGVVEIGVVDTGAVETKAEAPISPSAYHQDPAPIADADLMAYEALAAEQNSVHEMTEGEASHVDNANNAPGVSNIVTAESHAIKPDDVGSMQATPSSNEEEKSVSLSELTAQSWLTAYLQLKVGGVLQSTVSNCVLQQVEGKTLHFLLDASNATLYNDSHQERMEDVLSGYFNTPVKVSITVGQVTGMTPAMAAIERRKQLHQQAVEAISIDPMVQQLQTAFGITIDPERVFPE
ncbi:DNA polymerase III subunit gamma/tau [Marinibactrum halimedae]|nr:DNA polymerase III subunit gamma/tau [Marinibactrum halimedae]MCD9457868.1 DNA polymerase III subunit gamma/tau [Marinibactrum halimedae]